MKTTTLFILLLSLISFLNFGQTNRIKGSWKGTLSVSGTNLRVIFNFVVKNDTIKATLDSPDQGAKDIPLDKAWLKDDSIFIEGKKLYASYKGKMLAGDSTIDGNWKQGGYSLSLQLKKLQKEFKLNRPQEPKEPFPYKSEDVTFKNSIANIELAGTLTLPTGTGPFPAVILVTGSGAQNRNEELLGHKPFLVISDYLTRNGIAVLRYDDRGVAKSKGNFITATSYDFADDAQAALDYLKARPEIDVKKIGIAGHSEGGLIAPIVASRRSDLGFIVLLAGPGLPGKDIINMQTRLISLAEGEKADKVDEGIALNNQIWAILKKEKDNDKAKAQIKQLMENAINKSKSITEVEKKDALSKMDMQINQVSSNWFRAFLFLNPKDYLTKVKCPVLALNGEKDLQVPPKEDLQAIEKYLKKAGNKNYEVHEIPKLNHLFQHSDTGSPSKYGEIEETFAPEALKLMGEWILKVIK